MVEVESMLVRVREAVSEVVLIRSFESSSWSLVLVVESLFDRRAFRMQRVRVDMMPILDFGFLRFVFEVGIDRYGVVLELGVFVLTLMELGIAGSEAGLGYIN
jgi:hypothetical protein